MAYVKLIELVRKFDSGVIELPLMQRDYVWPATKVVDLLDSLYRGWPIGGFYIWKTPNRQTTRKAAISHKVGAKITEPFWGYLLDGQQRLTSLSRALDDKLGDNLAEAVIPSVARNLLLLGSMPQKQILRRCTPQNDIYRARLSFRHIEIGNRSFGNFSGKENGFGKRRMWMDGKTDVFHVRAHFQREYRFGD